MAEGANVDLASLEKLGEGYEAEIFAWEDGQALRLSGRGTRATSNQNGSRFRRRWREASRRRASERR